MGASPSAGPRAEPAELAAAGGGRTAGRRENRRPRVGPWLLQPIRVAPGRAGPARQELSRVGPAGPARLLFSVAAAGALNGTVMIIAR